MGGVIWPGNGSTGNNQQQSQNQQQNQLQQGISPTYITSSGTGITSTVLGVSPGSVITYSGGISGSPYWQTVTYPGMIVPVIEFESLAPMGVKHTGVTIFIWEP